eukprot:PhM_4_TR17245/c0_g1_i1/m.2692
MSEKRVLYWDPDSSWTLGVIVNDEDDTTKTPLPQHCVVSSTSRRSAVRVCRDALVERVPAVDGLRHLSDINNTHIGAVTYALLQRCLNGEYETPISPVLKNKFVVVMRPWQVVGDDTPFDENVLLSVGEGDAKAGTCHINLPRPNDVLHQLLDYLCVDEDGTVWYVKYRRTIAFVGFDAVANRSLSILQSPPSEVGAHVTTYLGLLREFSPQHCRALGNVVEAICALTKCSDNGDDEQDMALHEAARLLGVRPGLLVDLVCSPSQGRTLRDHFCVLVLNVILEHIVQKEENESFDEVDHFLFPSTPTGHSVNIHKSRRLQDLTAHLVQDAAHELALHHTIGNFYDTVTAESVEPKGRDPRCYAQPWTCVEGLASVMRDLGTMRSVDDSYVATTLQDRVACFGDKLKKGVRRTSGSTTSVYAEHTACNMIYDVSSWSSTTRTNPVLTRSDVGRALLHTSDACIAKVFVPLFTTRESRRLSVVAESLHTCVGLLKQLASDVRAIRWGLRSTPTTSGSFAADILECDILSSPILKLLDVTLTELMDVMSCDDFASEFSALIPNKLLNASDKPTDLSRKIVTVCKLPPAYALVGKSVVFLHPTTATALAAAREKVKEQMCTVLHRFCRAYLERAELGRIRVVFMRESRKMKESPARRQLETDRREAAMADREHRATVLQGMELASVRYCQCDKDIGKKVAVSAKAVEAALSELSLRWADSLELDASNNHRQTKRVDPTAMRGAAERRHADFMRRETLRATGGSSASTCVTRNESHCFTHHVVCSFVERENALMRLESERQRRETVRRRIAADVKTTRRGMEAVRPSSSSWELGKKDWIEWERNVGR